jgi:hypothetical protein
MIKKCPHCGRQVPLDEYFCPDCGEALFPGKDSAPEDGDVSAVEVERHDITVSGGHPDRPPAPGRELDYDHGYGYTPRYVPRAGTANSRPPAEFRMPWGKIAGVLALVIIVALGAGLYAYVDKPGIKISVPDGWSKASDGEKESFESSMNEGDSIEYALDHLFISDGNGMDTIAVIHFDASPDEEPFPETQDLEEMGRYIDTLEEVGYLPGTMVNIYELRNMLDGARALHLGCGQACIYIEENPEGVGAFETLVIGKDRRIFMIIVLKAISEGFPSPEMQHFIDTIELG